MMHKKNKLREIWFIGRSMIKSASEEDEDIEKLSDIF